MSLMEDASKQLAPHTKHLGSVINRHGIAITQRLDELAQASDIGRPDTDDKFKFLTVRGKLPFEAQTFDNLVGGSDDGGPTLGEIWMLQSICVNGQPNKSPGFTIRTNTGRLIMAVVPEGMGNENIGGDVVLLQGEILIFEPLAEGVFDFTVSLVQRKFPRQEADAGWGVSEAQYEEIPRSIQHEQERSFPGQGYTPGDNQDVGVGGDISPDVL
jgi:hypothetical protein